jgi:hypothetical protein
VDQYLTVLRDEFDAEEGSFLIQMRSDLRWDKVAFTRLIVAMEQCCQAIDEQEKVDRWVAGGFWYVSFTIRDWTTHEQFPQDHGADYYEQAYQRLDDLAFWFFMGESPYQEGLGFEAM